MGTGEKSRDQGPKIKKKQIQMKQKQEEERPMVNLPNKIKVEHKKKERGWGEKKTWWGERNWGAGMKEGSGAGKARKDGGKKKAAGEFLAIRGKKKNTNYYQGKIGNQF